MLIISDFHDYYDYVQKIGVDKQCVYNRTTENADCQMNLPPGKYFAATSKTDVHCYSGILGFCGQLYKVLKLNSVICFNADDVDAQLATDTFNDVARRMYHERFGFYKREEYLTRRWVKEWFDSWPVSVPAATWTLAPVWFARRWNRGRHEYLALNPRLLDLGFQKIKDAYTAYQEIYMYLSGAGGYNAPSIPEIDDKTLAEAKGFDKWSFRKEPSR